MLKTNHYFKLLFESRYVFLYTFAERIFFFVVFLIFARTYSTEFYGQLITVFTISNIAILFFDFGLPILLQREISIFRKKSSELLSLILFVNIFSFVAYFSTVYFYCNIFYNDISVLLKVLIILNVYTFFLHNLINRILFALSKFKAQFIILFISKLIILIAFILTLVFFQFGISKELFLLFIGNSVNILFLIFYLHKESAVFSFKYISIDGIKNILKISLPLGAVVIFNFLYDKIDVIIISKLTDFNQVAYYNIGYGIYKSSVLAFNFFLISGFSKISYINEKKYAVKIFFKKYALLTVFICLFVFLVFFIGSDFLIKLVFSDKYSPSSIVLKILSFAIFGLALNNLTGIILNGLGLYKQNMVATMTAVIINIVLNLIFIKYYGIIGACIVTIITEYLIFALDSYFLVKYLKVKNN
ncbi:MAG TPA: polysaccharide biosynthesis C-terminal domain-containing protein [Ignavibacteria bacterium]